MRTDYGRINYYNVCKIEAIEIIEALHLHFSCGNSFKYLYRSNNVRPKGDIISDLNKALYYLRRMLNKPILNSNSNTDFYLKQLDSSLFSENIYQAIVNVLQAGTCYDIVLYKNYTEEAILCIEAELNEY